MSAGSCEPSASMKTTISVVGGGDRDSKRVALAAAVVLDDAGAMLDRDLARAVARVAVDHENLVGVGPARVHDRADDAFLVLCRDHDGGARGGHDGRMLRSCSFSRVHDYRPLRSRRRNSRRERALAEPSLQSHRSSRRYHCNFRCEMCNIWQKKSVDEMTPAEVGAFLRALVAVPLGAPHRRRAVHAARPRRSRGGDSGQLPLAVSC